MDGFNSKCTDFIKCIEVMKSADINFMFVCSMVYMTIQINYELFMLNNPEWLTY